jgi:hypothetical protein
MKSMPGKFTVGSKPVGRNSMKILPAFILTFFLFAAVTSNRGESSASSRAGSSAPILGFRDSAAESVLESRFLAVPDPKLAEEHLRILTGDRGS